MGQWRKYVGEYKGLKKHGQGGTYTFRNGQKYEGEWKNSKRQGEGIETSSDGRQLVGEWQFDDIWNAVRHASDGTIKQVWKNDVPQWPPILRAINV